MTDEDNQSLGDDGHDNTVNRARGWSLGAFRNQVRQAGLYIVATPIGNLGDISLRALDTLAAVDIVLCEDTRVSKKLLGHYGIYARCEAYHDHSDANAREYILSRIQEGQKFALISDAGMPMISDPGYKLVRDLQDAEVYITSIPGANAPLAALQLSGMPSDAFSFIGFLPGKQTARRGVLEGWKHVQGSLIAFESASRLKACLADIAFVMGDARQVAVVREITKKFEEVQKDFAQGLVAYYEENGAPKGEIVLVIDPPVQEDFSDEDIKSMLIEALEKHGTKAAAAEVFALTGRPKKELYNLALTLVKGA